jgi:hypothetical protein
MGLLGLGVASGNKIRPSILPRESSGGDKSAGLLNISILKFPPAGFYEANRTIGPYFALAERRNLGFDTSKSQ